MISPPGNGLLESGLKFHWGVCTGSHGGYGKTLKGAMRKCLRFCGIGNWWHVGRGEGELMLTLFKRVARKHLGGLGMRPGKIPDRRD